MDKKTKIISSITAGGLFISAMLVSFSPVEAAISNGDLVQVKLNGGAWTNGNIQDNFTGTGDNMGIGGNNGSTQVPAVEVANQQAMNGYGPGDYIFTQATEIPGNGANPVWIQHFLGNYGFALEDKSQPSSKPIYGYYAGSDVYTLSGWYAQPNPYSNPYWYAPGQYVHLAPYAKPYVRIDSVQNGQSLVPGSTVTVTDTNNDPSDDGTGNPDKVPQSGTPSGLIAVWYFNNMGTYVNADVGHSNEQVATLWVHAMAGHVHPYKSPLILNFYLIYFREIKKFTKRHAKSFSYFIQSCQSRVLASSIHDTSYSRLRNA